MSKLKVYLVFLALATMPVVVESSGFHIGLGGVPDTYGFGFPITERVYSSFIEPSIITWLQVTGLNILFALTVATAVIIAWNHSVVGIKRTARAMFHAAVIDVALVWPIYRLFKFLQEFNYNYVGLFVVSTVIGISISLIVQYLRRNNIKPPQSFQNFVDGLVCVVSAGIVIDSYVTYYHIFY